MVNIPVRPTVGGGWYLSLLTIVGANLMLSGCARQITQGPHSPPGVAARCVGGECEVSSQEGHQSRWRKWPVEDGASALASLEKNGARSGTLQLLEQTPLGELPAGVELHQAGALKETANLQSSEPRVVRDSGASLPNVSEIASFPPRESEERLPELPLQLRSDRTLGPVEPPHQVKPQFELLPAPLEHQKITLTRPDAVALTLRDKFAPPSPSPTGFSVTEPSTIELSHYAQVQKDSPLGKRTALANSTSSVVETLQSRPLEAFPLDDSPANGFGVHAQRKLETARDKEPPEVKAPSATLAFLPTKQVAASSANRLRPSELSSPTELQWRAISPEASATRTHGNPLRAK